MTNEQALKMAKAKLECIERQTSGKAELCSTFCENCSLCYEQGNMGEQKELLKMAIKALENQCPSKGVDCEDCPANEPKTKTGHWIKVVEVYLPYMCSECGKSEFRKSNYCPNCGTEMQEVEK